jgi:hypothetical protein
MSSKCIEVCDVTSYVTPTMSSLINDVVLLWWTIDIAHITESLLPKPAHMHALSLATVGCLKEISKRRPQNNAFF